ncbi:O-acyltransferase like protein [Conger conger]|uniref:O-acyltransferase like protein n=1 Tax=Conger conger TaxID=82655 RepID=UPI002A5AEB8E|nr:O-acyltransferase like protein [Conger conger]
MAWVWSVILFCVTVCSGYHIGNVSQKCVDDTVVFLTELEEAQPSRYAVLMYDSFGKMGSDIEAGNVNRPGSREECQLASGPGFKGQYCQVFLKQAPIQYFVGVCVPDSCEETEVQTLVFYETFQLASKSLIPPVPPIILPDSKQGVYMAQCFTHTPPDFSVIISLFVCSLLIAIPLVATVYVGVVQCRQWKEIDPWSGTALSTNFNHYGTLMPNGSATTNNNGCIFPEATDSCKSKEDKRTKSKYTALLGKKTAQAWFLNSCAAGLLGTVNAGGNYASLNGIRILSLLWIISGHNLQFSTWNMDNYKRWRERVANNPLYVVAYSGPVYLSVDTFLLLGGLLSAKSFLALVQRADDTISLRLVASFLFKRLRRVQPLHIFIVCLTISVFSMVQNNSYDSITHNELQHCRKYWWSNVLLINNLLPVVDICVPWSWYLSVDFQYYTTTPLLVFLYRRNKFAMSALATILLLISILASAFITATVQLPVHQPTTLDYASFYEYYYNKPWTRYGPYLIGVFTGIFLNTKKSHLLKHQWQAALGWVSSVIVIAALIALSYVLRDVPDQPSIPHAAYQGLHRTLFGLCVAWVILACEEGYGGFINKMMSLKLWVPLSNISYACYMIHPLIIILYNGKQDTPTHYNDINFMYLFLGHTVLSGLVGYVLTVLIEKPYMFLKGLRG